MTVNPDFSDTPLDQRKINTTRSALFFPETRDFFLQDASALSSAVGRSRRTSTACPSSRAMSGS
ncbi:MAG: hypothetical protein U1E87_01540 [Alphaproteobacteria bacterium]